MHGNRWSAAWRRLFGLRGRRIEAEVDDELRFHLEMRAREAEARGVDPREARRQALTRFGDLAAASAECADIDRMHLQAQRRREWLGDLARDLRFAVRVLGRQRSAAVVIVACLALGIGSATTVFTVGDALLRRPMPFPAGDRLVAVGTDMRGTGGLSVSSFEDFTDWKERQHTFAAIGAVQPVAFALAGPQVVRVNGAQVTSGVLASLGVRAERGRLIVPGDYSVGAAPVAVVSSDFADRQPGGPDALVGRTIRLNGVPHEVVGVLAAGAGYPDGVQIWTSMPRVPVPQQRNSRSLTIIGALRPGVARREALADLHAVSRQLAVEHPEADRSLDASVVPLRDTYVGSARRMFQLLAAAAGMLLLIACANVAGLQLARATSRTREIALRTALGAASGRLVRQLLTESLVLALAGGVGGVALAYAGMGVVMRAIPVRNAAWLQPAVDLRTLAFAVAVSVLAGIAFGVAPALRLTHRSPATLLPGGARAGASRSRLAAQRTLVVAEIALALVIATGATFAALSVVRLTRVDTGYDAADVMTFRLAMNGPRYDSSAARVALSTALLRRIRAVPGVVSAGATSHLPVADCCSRFGITVEGEAMATGEEHLVTGSVVTPGYLETIRTPLVSGRLFTDADRGNTPWVTVINETFARQLFPGRDPIGRIVHMGSRDATVIGVVRDVKQARFAEAPEPQHYRANEQEPWDVLTFVVRTPAANRARVLAVARTALKELDPALPLYRATPMETMLAGALAPQRAYSWLLGAFAVLAIVLATAGIYGVTSYHVAQRIPEMGVRLALGSTAGGVLGLVLRQAGGLAVAGLAVGGAASVAAARVLTGSLYGVSATEPLVYAAAALVLGGTAVLSCVGPARRASAVDPAESLRAE